MGNHGRVLAEEGYDLSLFYRGLSGCGMENRLNQDKEEDSR